MTLGIKARHLRMGGYNSDPTGTRAVCGAIYHDSRTHTFQYYNGVVWATLCFPPPTITARYWRYNFWGCNCTSAPQQRLLNDFKLIDTGGTNRASGVVPIATPDETQDGGYCCTTDGSTATYWQGQNEPCSQYLEFDLGASYAICRLCSLSSYNTSYYTRYVCLSYCTGTGWCTVLNCYGAAASALCNIVITM